LRQHLAHLVKYRQTSVAAIEDTYWSW
jgi:hypothetical protein